MMRIILSPAKRMREDADGLPWSDLPAFLPCTERLMKRLQGMSSENLQRLWKCNDDIALQNVERLAQMELRRNLTPAILAYDGIAYQHMAPSVFTEDELAYVQEHLRILSGFYGALRPLDGVTSYRLEMQAKLAVDGMKDLYAFWGDEIAKEVCRGARCVVNLASKEYSRCISQHLPEGVSMIDCVFGLEKGEKIVEKATLCKMARGEMVRFMAENQIEEPMDLKRFDRLDFRYSPEHSSSERIVFLQCARKRSDQW